jgi:protein-disulfide isomerase
LETNVDNVQVYDAAAPAPPPPAAPRSPVWTTILVGVVMLAIGLAAGYLGRPLVAPQSPQPAVVASTDSAVPPASSQADPAAGSQAQPTLMDAVVAQTRHFKGDANAQVTIVEFGDFQ